MDFQRFVTEQFESNNRIFLRALENTPEAHFHRAPRGGGHSCAWHALHIAEWTRLLLPAGLEDFDGSARFAYLGWEDATFAKAVFGEPEVRDDAPKNVILEHLAAELERGTRLVAEADAARLTNDAKLKTPMGERGVLTLLTIQVRHVPYHTGQARVSAVQLAREDA